MLFWCNIRHLNPLKNHKGITEADKKVINYLDYEGIEFPVSKIIAKIEKKSNICIYYLFMELIWFILLMYQIKSLKITWIC